jgi:hypothetical protein
MRIACWIPKATNALSEYVMFIAFTRHQWLHERASMLCSPNCLETGTGVSRTTLWESLPFVISFAVWRTTLWESLSYVISFAVSRTTLWETLSYVISFAFQFFR